jgi:pectinesterase
MKTNRLLIMLLAMMVNGIIYAQPKMKIIVAKDGSGNYISLQAAFDAIPSNNKKAIQIYIKKGIYKEKLHLDSTKNFISLLGEDKNETIITFDDHTGKLSPKGDTINTWSSESFYIKADDFRAENLTFENNAGFTAGQAVSVRGQGDRLIFIDCRFVGFQDVLFASAENSRQYFRDCYIEGTTDFIFGAATALFENCHIHSKKNSHVTAASTPIEHAFGFVFKKCTLTADSSVMKVSLGRPWKPFGAVTYINCWIGRHIIAAGWDNWKNPENEKTARYAEYHSEGPGGNSSARAGWTKQLSEKEVNNYTTANILRGWIPNINRAFIAP